MVDCILKKYVASSLCFSHSFVPTFLFPFPFPFPLPFPFPFPLLLLLTSFLGKPALLQILLPWCICCSLQRYIFSSKLFLLKIKFLTRYYFLISPLFLGCNEAIIGNSLTALGASWHPHHFACFTCNLPLDGGVGFFERDGMPYCQEHYYWKNIVGKKKKTLGEKTTGKTVFFPRAFFWKNSWNW